MSEFCGKCSKEHGFKEDISVKAEFDKLSSGDMIGVLCEGCGMNAVGKTEDGKCVVYFSMFNPEPDKRSKWFYFDESTNIVGLECEQLNKIV